MANMNKAMKAIAEARKQATLAYVFVPEAHVYAALSACAAAEKALREELPPDWIGEYLGYLETRRGERVWHGPS
jgi:hypothetical protein